MRDGSVPEAAHHQTLLSSANGSFQLESCSKNNVPKDDQPLEQVPTKDCGSDDSLSETRPISADSDDVTSDSDVEDHLAADPVLQLGKKKPATAVKHAKKPTEVNHKQLCPVRIRGFQLRKLPI